MAKGSDIRAADYNSIRNKVVSILGIGLAQRGYGQPITSSSVESGNEITAAQWNALRNDIVSIRLHQEGVTPSIAEINTGTLIEFGAGHPNNNYNSVIDLATETRFNIATSRSVIIPRGSKSFSEEWNVALTTELTITFDNANEARHFFNSGSKIRFISTRTGGVISDQNASWSDLLTEAGIAQFGGNIPSINNFYALTDEFKIVFQKSPSGVYGDTNNFYRIEAKCNVADNTTGTANTIDFKISWFDNYVDLGPPEPGDLVDGTLTLSIEELKASGPLIPTGTFTIASPSYSLLDITGS